MIHENTLSQARKTHQLWNQRKKVRNSIYFASQIYSILCSIISKESIHSFVIFFFIRKVFFFSSLEKLYQRLWFLFAWTCFFLWSSWRILKCLNNHSGFPLPFFIHRSYSYFFASNSSVSLRQFSRQILEDLSCLTNDPKRCLNVLSEYTFYYHLSSSSSYSKEEDSSVMNDDCLQ